MKNPSTIHKAAQALGRLGGKAGTGAAKARTIEQARKAGRAGAKKRWDISVGTRWMDAKGRTWEIYERLPFGKYRVRTTDLSRVGEMSASSIRDQMQAAPNANIVEDNSMEPYHHNSITGTSNPEDPVIPAYRCARCKAGNLGDAQIK